MRGLAVWLTAALLAVGAIPAGAADKNAQYTEELLTILEETQSVDTFMTVLVLLKDQHVERHKFIPLVIRQAERLGIFAHHLGNKNLELTGQVEEFLHELATRKPTVKKRKKTPTAAAKLDHKNDFSTPVMPPIREGSPPTTCEQPPDDGTVLRAIPRANRGVPGIYEESREDVQVVTELLVDKVDAPRFFPLIGPAQLHHCHWKCTVYYTEMIEAKYPFAFRVKRPRVQVIYIDKDHLHLHPGTEKTSAESKPSQEGGKGGWFRSTHSMKYVIEPPDILLIEALRVVSKSPDKIEPKDTLIVSASGVLPDEPVKGSYVVDSEGRINLGASYGTVQVAGMTVEEARQAIMKQLRNRGFVKADVRVTFGRSGAQQQVRGERLVRPDGTVGLGIYGSVSVAGMTTEQAKAAIEQHLAQYLDKPEVNVIVLNCNSKFYYVITDGDGEQVWRFACTANETVIDAIARADVVSQCHGKTIWVARTQPDGTVQDLRVNWEAIIRNGEMDTNFQLLPGDRLYIKPGVALPMPRTAESFMGIIQLSPGCISTVPK